MAPPGAQAGLLPAVLLAVCLPVAVGLSIADGHGSEGRVRVEPDGDVDDGLMGPYEGGPIDGEPDTHVYDFEKDIPEFSRHYSNFPSNGHVAVVLRGASFRNFQHKQSWCLPGDDKAESRQKEATLSLVENVIVPLEQAGNTVDVILTDHACDLTRSKLLPLIGEQRVKVFEQSDESRDQNQNIMFALDHLANYSGGVHEVENKYSHVFLMRHDTHWNKPMNDWSEADFSKTLFPFKCPGYGVHDLFFLVPATYFWRWYKSISLRQCFKGADGHFCMEAMVWHAGEESVALAVSYDSTHPEKISEHWHTYGNGRPVC